MSEKCEYYGCNRKATKVLKTKEGILGRYCNEHYLKVLETFKYGWSPANKRQKA